MTFGLLALPSFLAGLLLIQLFVFHVAVAKWLIGLIGVMNGAGVSGGAEGVGRVTTRAVVQAITAIVVSDMVIVYLSTH